MRYGLAVETEPPTTRRPLEGVRVLELAQLVAAPTATALLAYFGADVVKVEEPLAGDPLRTWRETDDAGTVRFVGNAARVVAQRELDAAIRDFTLAHDAAEVIARLEADAVPVGPIYDAADMMRDPHFAARGLFEQAVSGERSYTVPAMLPRLTETPGATQWAGPARSAHAREVLRELGLDEAAIALLARSGVIAE